MRGSPCPQAFFSPGGRLRQRFLNDDVSTRYEKLFSQNFTFSALVGAAHLDGTQGSHLPGSLGAE